jgi:hypothetical protein
MEGHNNMKLKIKFLFITMVFANISFCAISEYLTFQGKLTDSSGEVLSGSYDIKLNFYETETGGTPVWSTEVTNVNVESGLYSIEISTNGTFDTQYWVEIGVRPAGGGTYEYFPRYKLTSSAYSFRSKYAESARYADNVGNLNLSGGITSTFAVFSGSVTANKFYGDGSGLTGIIASTTNANTLQNIGASFTPAPNVFVPLDGNAKIQKDLVTTYSIIDSTITPQKLAIGNYEHIRAGTATVAYLLEGKPANYFAVFSDVVASTTSLKTQIDEIRISSGVDSEVRLSTGILSMRIDNVAISTGLINSRIDAVAVSTGVIALSTGTLRVRIDNVAVSTGLINSRIDAVAVSTGMIAASTGTLSSRIDAVAVSTGAIALSTGTLISRIDAVSVSTGAIAASTGTLSVRIDDVAVSTGLINSRIDAVSVSTGVIAASTGTLSLRIDNVAVSTGLINSRIDAVAVSTGVIAASTGTLSLRIDNVAVSTGLINSRIDAVAVSTGAIALSTGTLSLRIDNVAVSTGTLVTLSTSQTIDGVKTFTSSVTVLSSDGLGVKYGIIAGTLTLTGNEVYSSDGVRRIFFDSGTTRLYTGSGGWFTIGELGSENRLKIGNDGTLYPQNDIKFDGGGNIKDIGGNTRITLSSSGDNVTLTGTSKVAGPLIVTGTTTVLGEYFSVGGSTFVVSNGWVGLNDGIRGINVTVSDDTSYTTVTLTSPQPDNNYAVFITPNWNLNTDGQPVSFSVKNKTTTSFEVHYSSAPSSVGSKSFDWLIIR